MSTADAGREIDAAEVVADAVLAIRKWQICTEDSSAKWEPTSPDAA